MNISAYDVPMNEPQVDVAALAKLARLAVSPEELLKLQKEIPRILEFVRTIEAVDVSGITEDRSLRNVMRADANPHESGIHTRTLVDAAPAHEGDRIAVKQVLHKNSAQGGSASGRK